MISTVWCSILFLMLALPFSGQAKASRCKNLSIPCLTKSVSDAATDLNMWCSDFKKNYPQWQTRRDAECSAGIYIEEEGQAALTTNEEPFTGTLWHRQFLSCQVNWSERHKETCSINETQGENGEYTNWDGEIGYRILSTVDLTAIPQGASYEDVFALFGKPLRSELPFLAWLKKRSDLQGEEASSRVRWRNAYWFLFERSKSALAVKSTLELKLIASTPMGRLANDKAIYEQFQYMTVDWPASLKGQRVLDHFKSMGRDEAATAPMMIRDKFHGMSVADGELKVWFQKSAAIYHVTSDALELLDIKKKLEQSKTNNTFKCIFFLPQMMTITSVTDC